MKHLATYLLLKLGGNDSPTADDVTKALATVGVEVDSDDLTRMMADLEGKDINEMMTAGQELLAKFGGGGGGGGGGGEAAPVVPVEMPQLRKKKSKRKKKLILVVVWICLVEETATVEITRFICFHNPINKPIQQDVFACSFFSLAYDDPPSMRPNQNKII